MEEFRGRKEPEPKGLKREPETVGKHKVLLLHSNFFLLTSEF